MGAAVAVLGFFLLITRTAGAWLLPLVAMGSMTLTLYSVHLLGLATEAHYDQPYLWFLAHLGAGVVLAIIWGKTLEQGPLERLVARAANITRHLVLSTGR